MFTCICLRDHVAGPFRFFRGDYFTAEMRKFSDLPEQIPAIRTEGIFSGYSVTNSPEGSWQILNGLRPSEFARAGFSPNESVRNMTDRAERALSKCTPTQPCGECESCGFGQL